MTDPVIFIEQVGMNNFKCQIIFNAEGCVFMGFGKDRREALSLAVYNARYLNTEGAMNFNKACPAHPGKTETEVI